jgi:hypothetical protein
VLRARRANLTGQLPVLLQGLFYAYSRPICGSSHTLSACEPAHGPPGFLDVFIEIALRPNQVKLRIGKAVDSSIAKIDDSEAVRPTGQFVVLANTVDVETNHLNLGQMPELWVARAMVQMSNILERSPSKSN